VEQNQEEDKLSLDRSQSESHLTGLFELSQMSYRLNEKEIVQKALAYAVQETESEIGYLNFVNMDQETFQCIAWEDPGSEQDILDSGEIYALEQAGVWADCIRDRKPVIYNDPLKFHENKGDSDGHGRFTRLASVPLFDKDSLRFVLSVGNKVIDYDSMDISQLYVVGEQLVRILHGRQVENALNKAKNQYDQLVKNIPIGIFRIRSTQTEPLTFEYVNQQFCEMVGLPIQAVYKDANSVLNMIHTDDRISLADLNRDFMQTKKPILWEGRFVIQGKTKWLRVEARPEDLNQNKSVWHGVLTDTTEQKQVESAFREANTLLENRLAEIEQLQEQLREQTIRDYLTGLFNRRYLDETIEREIARAKRDACLLSVVMIDIDHFKSINDTYGHEAGDQVLIELGALLNKYSRVSDIACRHGGDEFVVVMPNASPEDALKRADEWRLGFESKRFNSNKRRFATTLSMGIASYPLHASSPKGVFQAADQALYQSKIHNNKVSVSRRVATKMLQSIGRSDS